MAWRFTVKLKNVAWFVAGLVLGTILVGAAYAARPGEVDDPLISLSYLKTGTAFEYVILNDGEKIEIAPGEEFILLDGGIKLECVGDFQACDITRGKSYNNPPDVDKNHLVVFLGNSKVSVFAKGEAECLVRGVVIE